MQLWASQVWGTVGATVLGCLWGLEWAWHIRDKLALRKKRQQTCAAQEV